MISYTAALDLIRSAAGRGKTTAAPLDAALGGVAGTTVSSPHDVPGFANAALDGYALSSADASSPGLIELAVAGRVAAGSNPPVATPARAAWEIMTGAPMPAGCDAVVPYESIRPDGTGRSIEFMGPVEPGANRRLSGEDFRAGLPLVEPGQSISAATLMGLAAAGCDTVPLRQPPRCTVIVTGDELGSGDAVSAIRDANGPFLVASLRAAGLPLVRFERTGDDPAVLARLIERAAADSDAIITTGGVSAGQRDFMPAALAAAGATLLFHKVAIRPGKPLACARLPQGPLVFGLPGNPVAVAVGWRFFVVPWVCSWLGQTAEQFPLARVDAAVRRRPGLTFFAKARARVDEAAVLRVAVLPGQESFKIRPLMDANCWAIVPADAASVAAGDLVSIAPLGPGGLVL